MYRLRFSLTAEYPFTFYKVNSELQRLDAVGVTERFTQPTYWVSLLVVDWKPNNDDAVRLCVGMRCVNEAGLRDRQVMQTDDDSISDLNGATAFSKLDHNHCYLQL